MIYLSFNRKHRKWRSVGSVQLSKGPAFGPPWSLDIGFGAASKRSNDFMRLFLAVELAKHVVVILAPLLEMTVGMGRTSEHFVNFHTTPAVY
jgi:hypothetical protein